MIDWIATDADGNIVGKYRQHNKPTIPDDYELMQVDELSDYDVDYWWDD